MDRRPDGSLRRRDFLAASATALTALSASAASAPVEEYRNRQPGMTYRRLGRTGYMISSIGMGGDDISPTNIDQTLWAAEQGLNYFDTAPNYGNGLSEKGYAAVHKARGRDKFFQSTKVNAFPNRTMLYRRIFTSLPEDEQAKITAQATEQIATRKLAEPDYLGPYFNGQEGGLRAAIVANLMAEKYSGKMDGQAQIKKYILDSVDRSLKSLEIDCLDCVLMRGIETPYEISH
ncbi:MAG: aldo/keto reductase, partial [Acidobacteriia bacterium]|nr:aldo/keto reductase [Terriglobia bacterium]